ncbi:hypothetical protein AB0383_48485 [Amycolatopsis sp. NPDC051373]|uniref:hypothetical protein n=1 Tax=Amycolatopsis sp. NPDC051373 TaxID=3155801 RepID=UPI00344F86C0
MTSTINPPTDVVGEETQMLRPVRTLPDLPDPKLIRLVRREARRHLGMSELGAEAMSSMWVNPEEILPQISSPQRMRITGGELRYIKALVWMSRLVPDPANPRNASSHPYLLAMRAGAENEDGNKVKIEFERASAPRPMSPAELQADAASEADLISQLDDAMEKTRSANQLYPPIGEQGIMDAPFGIMTQFNFHDDSNPIVVPVVREGSSRTSHALKHLGLTAEDVLFKMPGSPKAPRQLIDAVNAIVQAPAETVTADELAMARVATVEFILIVGFDPDEGDSPDLGAAVKAKVAQEHINTKTHWRPSDRDSTMADDCLASALSAGVITLDEHRWLSGDMSREEAEELHYSNYLEDRFVRLTYLFATSERKIHRAIRKPIAFVIARDTVRDGVQVRRTSKLPLAVEVTVREFRFGDPSLKIPVDRLAKVLVSGANIAGKQLSKPGQGDLDELEQAALAELDDREGGDPGPAGIELALRALYYGAYHDAFRVQRNDQGANSDRRPVNQVLQDMLSVKRGILQLVQIIEDGRKGERPAVVNDHGIVQFGTDGQPAPLKNSDIRYKFFPKGVGGDGDDPDPFTAALKALKKSLKNLRGDFEILEKVEKRRVLSEGLPPKEGKNLVDELEQLRKKADTFFMIGLSRATPAELAALASGAPAQVDSVDEDEDEEFGPEDEEVHE